MTFSLEDAFSSAQQTKLNRRLLVALIDQADTHWWGGHVDNWQPDEALFSSGAALKGYRKLVTRFKKGETAKAHVLMMHIDGTFGAVMFGVESAEEAQQLLDDTLEEIRVRTSD
ncbi:hypothetical protein EVC45_40770 [Paraburkholderia sp. UYCP14C]|uniref:hypothetical protein n=1 Tax=Paraburkholderia sp. UYCP14C TaxID=2511130 RepID=UPI001021CDA7|nr:hypothetical protein [Paraburkholderia sp. UYCP14C]RZF24082.1 hypothetical protein EVC45_40770 [Paraburkholderia sp. UYCP14C]